MFLGDVVQVHLKQGTGTGCGEFFPGTHLGATVKADRYMNICVGPCPDADSDEDRNAVPDTTFAVARNTLDLLATGESVLPFFGSTTHRSETSCRHYTRELAFGYGTVVLCLA